ncbi:MAG: tellurite resistance TerB family protein [Polyangiaceae bacterium]
MTSATSKKPTKEKLSAMAEAVRKELSFRGQDDVYKHAVEIGYLAASADGRVDDEEKQRIVEAVDILSQGLVIELEVDAIIDEIGPLEGDAVTERAKAVGEALQKLDQAEAGLLFGAFVAQATHGIDKDERRVLRETGRAAGLKDNRIRAILKVVDAEDPEG